MSFRDNERCEMTLKVRVWSKLYLASSCVLPTFHCFWAAAWECHNRWKHVTLKAAINRY